MSSKAKFQAIKGTRDILPPDSALWNRVEQTAHSVFATYGFGEIRLPIFEQAELFARSIGADTDIVSKEMYTFEAHELPELSALRSVIGFSRISPPYPGQLQVERELVKEFRTRLKDAYNRGLVPQDQSNRAQIVLFEKLTKISESIDLSGQVSDEALEQWGAMREQLRYAADLISFGPSLTLRPEATASVCRTYIEHGMQLLPQPVKLYYMGPMFRRERPQKGRYRQFYQIGAEILGGPDAPAIDAELIEMLTVFFAKLGLEGAQLDINSIGCRECRLKYVELLRAALSKVKDKLGADSQRRIETNPLRVLDSKLESEQAIIAALPRIAAHLCDDCAKHYDEVKRHLALRGVAYRENWRLVRGLDYYMRTTFEITAPGLGSQNAVCGGGRYDGLVELLGGPATKGIGFAIGEDRLVLSLEESGKRKATRALDVYIAWMGDRACVTAIRAAKNLRDAGLSVELPATEQKFGKALGHADKLGARYALILGEDEIASGQWTIKTLSDGTQQKLSETDLLAYLKPGQ